MTDKEIVNADGSRNWEANILFDNIKRLEQENAELKAYKDVNEDFKTAWEELKAENERLKNLLTNIKDECSDKLTQEYDITDVTKRILDLIKYKG